jgi:hypothetical protein
MTRLIFSSSQILSYVALCNHKSRMKLQPSILGNVLVRRDSEFGLGRELNNGQGTDGDCSDSCCRRPPQYPEICRLWASAVLTKPLTVNGLGRRDLPISATETAFSTRLIFPRCCFNGDKVRRLSHALFSVPRQFRDLNPTSLYVTSRLQWQRRSNP